MCLLVCHRVGSRWSLGSWSAWVGGWVGGERMNSLGGRFFWGRLGLGENYGKVFFMELCSHSLTKKASEPRNVRTE